MNINLRKMHESEEPYMYREPHTHYINGMMKAKGISREYASKLADEEMKSILPDGMKTRGHLFYAVTVDEKLSGVAWLHVKEEDGVRAA